MKNEVVSKTLALVSIFLFISIIITPIITGNNFVDDTTPPITTYSLDPPSPDGENGWYVSDVNVTLNATDDISGVKEIKYRVDEGSTKTISGDNGTFIIDNDGDDIPVEYWAIDNVENEETHHKFYIDMDQTILVVDLTYDWELYDEKNDTYLFEFNVTAVDETSKMNRTEFYLNGILWKTVNGPGPYYIWEMIIDYDYTVWGKILKKTVTNDYIRFFAKSVTVSYEPRLWMDFSAYAYDNAGNSAYDEILYMPDYEEINSKWFNFTNDYRGYIGKFYIHADFDQYPINITPGNINFQFNKINNRLSTGNLFLRFLDHFPLLHRLLDIWRHVLI